jgi:hypothetical protein
MCLSTNSRYLREPISSLLLNISCSLMPYFDEFSINKYLCGEVNGLRLCNVTSPEDGAQSNMSKLFVIVRTSLFVILL